MVKFLLIFLRVTSYWEHLEQQIIFGHWFWLHLRLTMHMREQVHVFLLINVCICTNECMYPWIDTSVMEKLVLLYFFQFFFIYHNIPWRTYLILFNLSKSYTRIHIFSIITFDFTYLFFSGNEGENISNDSRIESLINPCCILL